MTTVSFDNLENPCPKAIQIGLRLANPVVCNLNFSLNRLNTLSPNHCFLPVPMNNLLRLIVGGFFAALFAVAAQAADLTPGAVTVGVAKGDVTYKIAGTTTYLAAPAGTALSQGATVKTGPGSLATLVFSSGSVATLRPDTEVEVSKFEQEAFSGPVSKADEPSVSNTQLNLIDGEVISNVNKLKKGSQFVVNSPIGAAGVRGTIFSIKINRATGAASVVVLDGSVRLQPRAVRQGQVTLTENADGNPFIISKDEAFNVAPIPGGFTNVETVVARVLATIQNDGASRLTKDERDAIIAVVEQQLAAGAPNAAPDTVTIDTSKFEQQKDTKDKTTTGDDKGPTVPKTDVFPVSIS